MPSEMIRDVWLPSVLLASLFAGPSCHPSGIASTRATDPASHRLERVVQAKPEISGSVGTPSDDQKEVLRVLRAQLKRIASAGDDEPVAIYHEVDPKGLLGLRRDQIADALDVPLAPCAGGAQCEFSIAFYKLPPGWRGGGPELRLVFGQNDATILAKWYHTR